MSWGFPYCCFADSSPSPPVGDPNLKSGNGIPARCVYLEEMAADLEDQDWLDMENVEQVSACKHLMGLHQIGGLLEKANLGRLANCSLCLWPGKDASPSQDTMCLEAFNCTFVVTLV